ncbi:NAD(P)H-dependent FMN reductase [Streptomyces sp. DvalAA-14]|uniref:NADPH-dependent FMN reductase n=1 Tax=unclassified Streptomyces TaxID=2593676 RepID=UPI00081B563D|nr:MULTISPECIES: NAD(P)H-dependent oxidoreductase [unclassified Streptomyces]MYS19323.1 NADPH-dependent FMN reductase [Streptomyces sp. SID4948]SCD41867.1 NAD(P)H-dependent FMN reductase [Streptomyces sp. DvalAA-14]
MTDEPLSLAVITASVRDGRLGPAVADWFLTQVKERPEFAVQGVDLIDHPLPLILPEPGGTLPIEAARIRESLRSVLARADAFVVVTPEYNHSFPAALKNTVDWFYQEWAAKPVGFVSYGGLSGGIRAVEQLRQVFAEVHALTVRENVALPLAGKRFDAQGRLDDPEPSALSAGLLLDQVGWWGRALRTARGQSPYPR